MSDPEKPAPEAQETAPNSQDTPSPEAAAPEAAASDVPPKAAASDVPPEAAAEVPPGADVDHEDRSWEFPGWGTAAHIDDLPKEAGEGGVSDLGPEHHQLGEVPATAICGNDITSSCLYVSALSALYAGPLAPLCLLAVAAVLYLFRGIYAEVGSALPLNGGAYNALLNTTSKGKAAVAAALTILSYMATAVISAAEAMHYAALIFGWTGEAGHHNVHIATIVLLGLFAFLNILGVSESAVVAVGIFVFHITTLVVLVLVCGTAILQDPSTLWANLGTPMTAWPTPYAEGTWIVIPFFFGFASAMLGVSGFESSANFIEEQKPGVFPKTLRNMWIAVAIFNPLISVLTLGILKLSQFADPAVKNSLLAAMGKAAGAQVVSPGFGETLSFIVCVNAVCVLSGAVLTSYVGVTGLVRRLSLDLCLPQFLLQTNSWRGTNHWIILAFFFLCVSVNEVTGGSVPVLAGVYTLSFLSVMALFAIGNMLLKLERDRLPRETQASWGAAFVALGAVLVGIVGNATLNPSYVRIFGIYFFCSLLVLGAMFFRVPALLGTLLVARWLSEHTPLFSAKLRQRVIDRIQELRGRKAIFFTSTGDPAILNRAALYVLENEDIRQLKVIHCYDDIEEIDTRLGPSMAFVDRCYPKLKVDLLLVEGAFDPVTVDHLSRRLDVPKNYMFLGTPGDHFPHQLADLGGVRLIM